MIPPGIEPGTLSVLDSRDNHYTMESYMDLIYDTLVCIHVAQSSIIAITNKLGRYRLKFLSNRRHRYL